MLARNLIVAGSILWLAGCAYHRGCHHCEAHEGQGTAAAAQGAGGGEGEANGGDAKAGGQADAAKVRDLERQLDIAGRKRERAQMDLKQQEQDGKMAVEKAEQELAAAERALGHFEKFERPHKLARGTLGLQGAKDNVTEQLEEMQQLELMYEKDDLADKTKEIVLARGRRRVERAQISLELQKKELDDLEAFELAEQRIKLERAVQEKSHELEKARFAARTGWADKQIALDQQQNEIQKLEDELAKARGGEGAKMGGGMGGGAGPGKGPGGGVGAGPLPPASPAGKVPLGGAR